MAKLWLIGGAGLLAVLLVASVAVALTRTEAPLPEGSPERVVQQFLLALKDNETRAAHDLLSEELKAGCPLEIFAGQAYGRRNDIRASRVALEHTETLNELAFVTARVTQVSGSGPFGASESSFEQRFTLVDVDGDWRLREFGWPFVGCPAGATVIKVQPIADLLASDPLPVDTPERTLQQFLVSVRDEDYALAHRLLSRRLTASCDLQQFTSRDAIRPGDRASVAENFGRGDKAVLAGRVTRVIDDETGHSELVSDETFTLVREADLWRIYEWPWPFEGCGGLRPTPAPKPPGPRSDSTPRPSTD